MKRYFKDTLKSVDQWKGNGRLKAMHFKSLKINKPFPDSKS